MYDFEGFVLCIKTTKSEPLEIGTSGEYPAFRGLRLVLSDHSIKKLEERPNLDKTVSVRLTRGSKKLEYKL